MTQHTSHLITTASHARRRAGRPLPVAAWALAVSSGLLLSACGGRGAKPPLVVDQDLSQIGTQNQKPGGGSYIIDTHGGGQKPGVRIQEMFWGRLVEVVDSEGDTVYRDYVVDASRVGDPLTGSGMVTVTNPTSGAAVEVPYLYDQNAITGIESIRISAADDPDNGDDLFDRTLRQLTEGVSQIEFAAEDELGLLTRIPRNCAIVVRFDDLIDRNSVVLNDTVKVLTGNPPSQTFDARLVMDPNHGGIAPTSGSFVSTRLIIDTTVGVFEPLDTELNGSIPLNNLGLPAANSDVQANVSILFPTQLSTQTGQFQRLTNLAGKSLFTTTNGPISSLPSADLVRAMRTSEEGEAGDAFLRDTKRPEVIGSQNVQVSNPVVEGAPGDLDYGYEWTIDFSFDVAACAEEPEAEDVVQFTNDIFGNVIEPAGMLAGNVASSVRVSIPRVAGIVPDSVLADLEAGDQEAVKDYIEEQIVGTSVFRHRFDGVLDSDDPTQLTPAGELDTGKAACFATFTPGPSTAPSGGVPYDAQVTLRFSEPMDPATFSAFDSYRVTRRPSTQTLNAYDYVIGSIAFAPDLREFRFQPLLPLSNVQQNPGASNDPVENRYHLGMVSNVDDGLRDLNGNPLLNVPDDVDFTVLPTGDPQGDTISTGGYVLRFEDEDLDETGNGNSDIRGQFVHDQGNGILLPRGVSRFSRVIDTTIPAVAIMNIPQVPGVQTPLSNLGSRLHATWRYEDMGLTISPFEGTFTDLDVEFTYLNPVGGQITAAFYPEFMLGFAHGCCHPDEINDVLSGFPQFPTSGFANNSNYAETYLDIPGAKPDVLHAKPKGFEVANSELFNAETGLPLLRMPLNKGVPEGERATFTWRDTSIAERGALAPNGNTKGPGVPTRNETVNLGFPACDGSVYGGGQDKGVPTVGLPLLLEYRTYPTETLALINFGISISNGSSRNPFHRAFSTGGYNTSGAPVPKNPDSETSPSGGFQGNPLAPQPLGSPTPGLDNSVYYGQLDFVVRLSRAHTVPIDANGNPNPIYRGIVLEPSITQQPTGTSIQVEYRGHDTFIANNQRILDADNLDVYGFDVGPNGFRNGTPPDNCNSTGYSSFVFDAPNWQNSLSSQNERQYVQYRFTFVNNVVSQLTPTIDSFGVGYEF